MRSCCRVGQDRGQVRVIMVDRQVKLIDLPDEPNVIKAPPGEV